MKKYILSVFSLLLILSMVACSNGGNADQAAGSEQKQQKQENQQQENKTESDFPKKAIEMIVPFSPGGATDIAARIVANAASKYLPNGQSVVVVNQPGGSASIGMTKVANAKPDGYTIGFTTISPISIVPHMNQTSYSYDSFQPIMRVLAVPLVLAIKSDAPWKDFDEWLNYVKQNPNKYTYATAGVGGAPHIVMEWLNQEAGIKTKQVSFDGGGAAKTALMGGHVQGAVLALYEATGDFESGKLRPLVNLGETKFDMIKDLPTLKEKGINVAVDSQSGIFAPKGLPAEIQNILHDAFKKALEDAEVKEQLKKLGVEPAYKNSEEFQQIVVNEYKVFGEIMKKAGLIK